MLKKILGLKKRITNNYLNDDSDIIWLIGDGRSGTTWVTDLINHNNIYDEMFEPFHPKCVRGMKFLLPHQYIKPFYIDEKLERVSKEIFSGNFTHKRVNSPKNPTEAKGVIVKDIFANLMSYSICHKYQKIKPILLLRNPFSVALSKLKKKDWFWVTEPLDLLKQKDLYDDYLYAYEELIKNTSKKKNFILNQILIWSIINYIPLRQFNQDKLLVCFYEDIYNLPTKEINRIYDFIGKDYNKIDNDKFESIILKPSKVAGSNSTIKNNKSPILLWKDEIPAKTIDEGLKILEYFGFEQLYDKNSLPNMCVIEKIQNKG
jgi:hypothetical protein